MECIKRISINDGCDFINIENKGYEFGNNIGFRYTLENYDFKYKLSIKNYFYIN